MKTKYKTQMFFAPDEGGGEGGGEKGLEVFEGEPTGEPKVEAQEEPKQKEQAPVLDAKEFAKEFAGQLGEAFKPAIQPEKKVDELSPEEADKLLNVWKPTKEWLAKAANLETQEEAFKELRDGVVKHTDTITQYRVKEATDKVIKELEPLRRYVEERREVETIDRFNKQYDQLSNPALAGLRNAIALELEKAGKKYPKEEDLFQDIAEGMAGVIRVNNPDFKLSAGSTPAEKNKPKGQPRVGIPVTTPGAGGGTAAKTGSTVTKRGLAIFE